MRTPALALPVLVASALLAPPVAAQDPGYERSYVIRADAAWLSPTERLSPAFVGVDKGRIEWVAAENRAEGRRGGLIPSAPARVIEVEGTLAAGIVDAWCRIGPGDLLAENREQPLRRLRSALPVQRHNESPELVAQVLAARDSGIAALYLAAGHGRLRAGVGTPAGFSGFHLPVAKGREALDCAVGRALGPAATHAAQDLADAFGEAQDWRDSLDEHREKMEQYEKDLAEYRKKFDEYAKKKEEADKAAKAAGGGGDKPPGKNGEAKNGEAKDGEKKDEAPKRPERPKEPKASSERDLLLEAMDGRLAVRVVADDPADILSLLAVQREHGLDLVVLGGWWADQVAHELADAQVPVVLGALPDHHAERFPERSLVARWRALRTAGVEVALASGGGEGEQALLLAHAGELVAAGEEPAAVWSALTEVPARILGLEAEYGAIAAGHSASLILFEGTSPFDASGAFRAHKPR